MGCSQVVRASCAFAILAPAQLWGQCDVSKVADSYFQPLITSGKAVAAAVVSVSNGAEQPVRLYGSKTTAATLWRTASVSKAFTAIAVMQLAEEHKLELDSDIRDLLPSSAIQNPYAHPVTARELLLHTAGVDDRFIGDGFMSGTQPSMTDIVKSHPLDVVYQPGAVELYSNYGYALLGAAIERASGLRFESYMQEHVLRPLGMFDSTFDQPLPAEMRARVAPGKWVYQHAAPASALTATAADILRFLSATLNSDGQLLSKSSFEQMVPASPPGARIVHGMGYWTGSDKGFRLIAASGDIEDFHNVLVVFPQLRSGFAVMVSGPRNTLAWNFYKEFLGHCTPQSISTDFVRPPLANAMPHGGSAVDNATGLYRTVRYPHREFSKTFVLFDTVRVKSSKDQKLVIGGTTYSRAGDGEYVPDGVGTAIRFVTTVDGKRFLIEPGFSARERIHWWETGIAAVLAYVFTLIVFIFGLVRSRGLARLLCAVPIMYSIGWLTTVLIIGPGNLITGMPSALRAFLAIGTALPALLAVLCILAIRRRSAQIGMLASSTVLLMGLARLWHLYWP